MALANGDWKRSSIHAVVAAFLNAERGGYLQDVKNAGLTTDAELAYLLDAPDFAKAADNHRRFRLLYLMRCRYFGEIPPDTEWYEVDSLTDTDLSNLYVTRHPAWTDRADNNELLSVAARKKEPNTAPPSKWKSVILWGHDRTGPFTIIEGNHRLVGYVANNVGGLNISVFVGLSSTPCFWHPLDPQAIIMADMWRA